MSDRAVVEGKYIDFWPAISGAKPTWIVRTKLGGRLGDIAWLAKWRKFCLYPDAGTGWEEICLKDISAFIVARTKEERAKAREAKP